MINDLNKKYIEFFKLNETRDLHYKNNMINLFNVFYWIKRELFQEYLIFDNNNKHIQNVNVFIDKINQFIKFKSLGDIFKKVYYGITNEDFIIVNDIITKILKLENDEPSIFDYFYDFESFDKHILLTFIYNNNNFINSYVTSKNNYKLDILEFYKNLGKTVDDKVDNILFTTILKKDEHHNLDDFYDILNNYKEGYLIIKKGYLEYINRSKYATEVNEVQINDEDYYVIKFNSNVEIEEIKLNKYNFNTVNISLDLINQEVTFKSLIFKSKLITPEQYVYELKKIDKNKLPKHLAMILDGNGRWGAKNKNDRVKGSIEGFNAIFKLIGYVFLYNTEVLTLHILSTDNINKRPKRETNNLFRIMIEKSDMIKDKFNKHNIKMIIRGDIYLSKFDIKARNVLLNIERATKDNKFTVVFCVGYSGRDEIISLCNRLVENNEKNINEDTINKYLNVISYPDLLIRTGGEQRVSDFLPWDLNYCELYFCKKLLPDINIKDVLICIKDYSKRNRRMGGFKQAKFNSKY